jgi:hypothetical protein
MKGPPTNRNFVTPNFGAGKRRSEQLTRNRELELCDVKLPRNAVR